MNNAKSLSEIDIAIREAIEHRTHEFRRSRWLISNYYALVWVFIFDKHSRIIVDWRVKVAGGHLLTNPIHQNLLDTFKCWVLSQHHPNLNGGCALGAAAASYRARDTLQLIDYFLLNAERLEISRYGLKLLTESDIYSLLQNLSSSSRKHYSIYQWPVRLTSFLKEKISQENKWFFETALAEHPWLAEDIPDKSDWELGLNETEIIYARAWLWRNDFYKQSTADNSTTAVYRRQLKTVELAKIIYRDTLCGHAQKPQISELKVLPVLRYKTEYQAAPVSNQSDDSIHEKLMPRYYSILNGLRTLEKIGLPVPTSALSALSDNAFKNSLPAKAAGRFKTLPASVVFKALRISIEFIIEYGDAIVESTLTTLASAHSKKAAKEDAYTSVPALPTEVSDRLNVEHWSIIHFHHRHVKFYLNKNPESNTASRHLIHSQIRNHEGLYELLIVLYGAIQICVGVLMARRQGELMDLMAGQAIDNSEENLIFENRKSGSDGYRETELRPIPKIGVRAINLLERLQIGLIEIGLIEAQTNLFSFPKMNGKGLVKTCVGTFNRALNFFCDYAELPLDAEGRRYYIRQHQLRRFFAMLFFWGGNFGNLDTLRWFLGHTDVEHIYYYITETTPGEVLRGVKVQFIMEQFQAPQAERTELEALVEKHFGTQNFSVLDTAELEEYIEDLILGEDVIVEPEFFDTENGRSYKIIVKVISKRLA